MATLYALLPTKRSHQWILLCILVTAAVARLGFDAIAPPERQWADAATYNQLALNLLHGNGYSTSAAPPFEPTRFCTPTYPIWIALIYFFFGPIPKAVLIGQAFLGTATVFLTYLLGKRFYGEIPALIAAAITATYPALIYYDNMLLRESFTTFWLVAIAVVAFKSDISQCTLRRLLSLGILFTIISMCRPETLLAIIPFSLFALKMRFKHWRPALILALPILLTWSAWSVRNYVVFGSLSPTSMGVGSVLWFGSRWAAIGGDDHTEQAREALQEKTKAFKQEAFYDKSIAIKDTRVEQEFLKAALQDIAQKPVWFLEMVYTKMILFWKDANGVKKTLPAIHPALPILLNTYYYSLLILALVGFGMHRHHGQTKALLGIIITYMMIYALLHVRNRYRLPILPLVFVLSSGGIQSLYQIAMTRWKKTSAVDNQTLVSYPEQTTEHPPKQAIS